MKSLWRSIREPRVQRACYAIIYALICFAGLSALTDPPSSIQGEIGPLLTVAWGAFLSVGGVAGAVSIWPGLWWLERIGIISTATGGGIYAVVILSLHLSEHQGNRLPQFFIVTALSLLFALRAWEIRGLDYEPRG